MKTLTLKRLPGYTEFPGPVVTVIMDGMGIGPRDDSNGIYMAYTPTLDGLSKGPLSTQLKAHGKAVGMPSDDDMGNSEVGHNALGAGRIFSQGAKLVSEAIASGKIFESKAWEQALVRTLKGGTLHLMGMISDGNVHSHITHLYALLDRAAADGIKRVRVHGLIDGRDVGEKSALTFFEPLEKRLKKLSTGGRDYRIASGGGRMVTTMDRYNADWGVVKNGWDAHVLGKGRAQEWMGCACPGKGPSVLLGHGSHQNLLRGRSGNDGSVHGKLRHRRKRKTSRRHGKWGCRYSLQLSGRPRH